MACRITLKVIRRLLKIGFLVSNPTNIVDKVAIINIIISNIYINYFPIQNLEKSWSKISSTFI